MKLVFSRRALSDLDQIAKYYNDHAGQAVAQSIGQRIEDVMTRITTAPESAPRVSQRPHIRVASVVRYPFKIFYRLNCETIDILYIRHTSRQPL